jgi:hypothetical protein
MRRVRLYKWSYELANKETNKMARFANTSAEYLAMIANETDDAAFAAYIAAEIKALAVWDAISSGEAKDSAHTNADEMMHLEKLIMAEDKLGWLRAAIDTYEMNT